MLTAVDAAPSAKDVVLAVVGASAALAGFVLVFTGILVTSYQGLIGRPGISDVTLSRFRSAAWLSVAVFGVTLLDLFLGVLWLDRDGGHSLYRFLVNLFYVELACLAITAGYVTARVLLRS
jgi:hypothetical protein